MKHPINSYHDLAFVIKQHTTSSDPKPPKFLVFFNSRSEAQAGAEFLRERLDPELRDKVKWFHSGMTDEFREVEMHALLIGDVYGHAATDAAGMVCLNCLNCYLRLGADTFNKGIDIPDITLVVQYRVPRELSTWIQRAGRAARNPNLQATAILIAEPSYFDDEKEKVAQKTAERNSRKRRADGELQPSTSQRPRLSLNSHRPHTTASTTQVVDPETNQDLRCEKAMDDFINAERRPEKCRRRVVNNHFGNNDLRKSFSLPVTLVLTIVQLLLSIGSVAAVALPANPISAVISVIQPISHFLWLLTCFRNQHDVQRNSIQENTLWATMRIAYAMLLLNCVQNWQTRLYLRDPSSHLKFSSQQSFWTVL